MAFTPYVMDSFPTALTYFSIPAKLKWIADMTDLPERAAETALEDLTDRSILTSDPSAQTYFLPPLTAKDLIWLHEQAETRALAADDKANAGWRAWSKGFTCHLRNQPVEVLECAFRAAKHWEDSSPRNKASAIYLRGHGHRLAKDYPAAIAAYRETLEIYRSISPESDDVSITLNSLAGVERENKDYDSAERNYREGLRISRKTDNQEHITTRVGNLAVLALDREQWAEAESLTREALVLAEKVGRQELIAWDCSVIATALLKQNKNLDEALYLSRGTVEIYTRLRHPNLQEAQKGLAEIEKALGER